MFNLNILYAMAVYSTNQNRQLYVVKAFKDFAAQTPEELSAVGDIGVKCINDGVDKELFFMYKGADTVLKSDRIQLKNLNYVKAVAAADMVVPLKKIELTLATEATDSGAPISGQDYILRINLRQFYGMSDEDQYFKDAAVHATANMTASDFYKAMVESLKLAFSREVGATRDSNPYLDFAVDNTTTATKIVITEKPQAYTVGIGKQERVLFEVMPTTVYAAGDDVIWGTVEDKTPAKANAVVGTTGLGNGPEIADLEWFCMGERGDQYRMQGYPNYIPTQYMVDPTQQYHVLEFHFGFTDTGVNSYRSEKDITIVAPTSAKAALNSLIGAINTATGLQIATLA
jgi:hypothetical protein